MDVDQFIRKWQGIRGGAERANYQLFLTEFAQALELPTALPGEQGVLGDYQFDGPIAGGAVAGGVGFADLYKKGCFILEAKQSKLPEAQKNQPELFDVATSAPASPSGARYDGLMRGALAQAKRYAVNLPGSHPWPPFLIVCDVGRAFELYFDWSGNGRGYGYFPDQQNYRFELADLASEQPVKGPDRTPAELFRAIWTNPTSVDPRAKSAEVSRAIAKRLADVSKWLESTQKQKTADATDSVRSLAIEETALFLMRVIFCMFAEDVRLLPEKSFTKFLEKTLTNEAAFEPELRQLWEVMGSDRADRYASAIGAEARYFNGGLFASAKTYPLSNSDRGELFEAAKADWTKVEPAIFGTLLEQALTASERAKLGAHYTPRPYVERLVQATIMDLLEGEWAELDQADAATVAAFHDRLVSIRVLDPACGTGNFLYVALENLMRLESDVIETIRQLGGQAEPRVDPRQFLGLELNPRAAVIAELVLWIGWLRWRMKNDAEAAPTPVLKQFGNINFGGHAGYDAVLRHKPTGEADTDNPMIPDWPEADFIVGNPPFIGKGSQIREALGNDYIEALWRANPRVPKSADFVMQWWDRAAHQLAAKGSPLKRFGFVTTNSITQTFSRRVIEKYLKDDALSLILAIPDHPWTKATKDAAAVRIAMTVAGRGNCKGRLIEIVSERALDTDDPKLEATAVLGKINSDLSVGADVTSTTPLNANQGLSCNGMMLAGQGFWLDRSKAEHLAQKDGSTLESSSVIRRHIGGNELTQRLRDGFVIDFTGFNESDARQRYPAAYQWLLQAVKPERDQNSDKAFREKWWLFGRTRPEIRKAIYGLTRYIATTRTSKHRIFQFVKSDVLPNHEIVVISSDDSFHLGVLSSRFHTDWVLQAGGTLEDRPRYNKGSTFDPFPFPDATREQRAAIAELAEELDATRKQALAEVPGLTMTELYNLRERWRSGAEIDLIEQARVQASRAPIVDRLHEQIDAAVAEAYGWPADLPPSEIVARLVALNHERAAEEKAGTIRWLRPDYQVPRFGRASSPTVEPRQVKGRPSTSSGRPA